MVDLILKAFSNLDVPVSSINYNGYNYEDSFA